MLDQKHPNNRTTKSLLLQNNVSLADKNWFHTGGPARYFAEPTTAAEFQEAFLFARQNNQPIFVLGQGANILISDNGFDGLVIRPNLKTILHSPYDDHYECVTVGAGVDLHAFIDYCLENNLSGLEEFSGIPSTIGGAVYINIHYFEFLLDQFLLNAQVIEKDTGKLLDVTPEWFNFGYNRSTLLEKNHFLVSATFKLKKISALEAAYAQGRRTEIIRHRQKRYPYKNTCGSFFRNFYQEEVKNEKSGKQLIFVAYYLDKLGIKGALSVGDAIVSHQHANMIVNRESATSNDIVLLARTMQEMVQKEFGILPQPECQFIGFKEYPLYR